jgi:leucyl aminopeptidase
MKIEIACQKITDFTGDIIIVNLFEEVKTPGGATGAVDKALGGIITQLIASGEITGILGKTAVFHTFGKLKTARVMVVGLGTSSKFGLEQVRKASGAAARKARELSAQRVGTIVHGAGIGGIDPEKAAQALIEGTLLALYTFKEYKKPEYREINDINVIEMNIDKIDAIKKGAARGQIIAECQYIARDLVNEPANALTPMLLDKRLKSLIKQLNLEEKIQYESLNAEQMKKSGMDALLSVARGSHNEPRFILMKLKNSRKPLTCLIGKTVTFDSGGISLKRPEGMGRMKGDMSGGAAVIGATLALARMNRNVNLMTIVPAVENMPSGTASRPGDVVRAMNHTTIEIISTDAEGRMTLADALCYAEKKGAETIIDVATLTGGSVVALGDITAAIMGNNQKLINTLLCISEITGEHFWQLPLFEEYKEQIKSDIADVKNSGGRKASAITAGIFLQRFVSKAQWMHIDIAGKEYAEKAQFYTPIGGTGFGTRSLVELIQTYI